MRMVGMGRGKREEAVAASRRTSRPSWNRVKFLYYEHDVSSGCRPHHTETYCNEGGALLLLLFGGVMMLASIILLVLDLSLDRPVPVLQRLPPQVMRPPPPGRTPPRAHPPPQASFRVPRTPDNSWESSFDTTGPRLDSREYWL